MFIEPTIIDKSFPSEHVHCVNCIKLNCKQGDLCPLIHCNFCGVRLHKCKLEDHIEHICGKAPCTCPNTIYGCNVRLRRQLIAEHIAFCCASLVFCPFVRNRQFYSAKAKKLLKRIARTGEKIFPENEKTMEELNELEVPDIAIALIDQKILTKFFQIPRKKRSTLRPTAIAMDFIKQNSLVINKYKNRQNEVVSEAPLEDKNFYKRKFSLNEPDSDYFDSSDEEKQEIEIKNKKICEPFAGCRLCKLDPGSQHLHQLGSMKENKENGDFEQKKKNILKLFDNNSILSFLPEFYRKRSLLVTPNIPFLSIVLGEEYLSVNYPIFGCAACSIPRSQFSSHYASHNILDESTPYNFIARCPNWQRGCSFKMNTLTPLKGNGVFRYNSFLSACVYEPMPNLPILMCVPSASSSGFFLAEMPSHFYLLIARWMDDASLRTLSVTCSRMYQLLPKLLPHRLCVEIKWKKKRVFGDGFVGNRFVEDGFYESFSAVQGSIPSLIVQPQGPIIDHLQNCDYRDVYDLGIEPIELKKVHGSFVSAN